MNFLNFQEFTNFITDFKTLNELHISIHLLLFLNFEIFFRLLLNVTSNQCDRLLKFQHMKQFVNTCAYKSR